MTSSNGHHEFLGAPDNPGELGTLGSYRVISQLGKGGMGFVFRAEDKRLKRTVALKVMNKKVAATPHSRARFISEARAMAAVHHDNVATIFEVGEHSGTPFMAMEMLKGQTMEDYKQAKERPNFEAIIRFAKETAAGLAAAHAQGIVHRDIKPANIWVEEGSERIKILDFGLALAQTPVDQLAGRGSVVGTPGYLSPEQARTEPLDDRSDLYSLGVVLYELATGKLPLRSSTIAGQLIAILAHQPQPIREINDKIPQPLADLIHRLLRKEPRNRVSSAAELVKLFDQVAIDCESKSEVALAINKLQMGLQDVVSKKQQPEPLPPAPDPFASIPDTPIASLPGVDPLAVPAAPLATPARIARPRNATAKPKAKQQNAASLQKYWPIAAGLLIAAIIGIVLFFALPSSDSGPTGTSTAAIDNQTDPKPEPKPKPAPSSKSPPNNDSKPPQRSNQNNVAAVPVSAKQIATAAVPGAVALIDPNKGNGSFENTTTQQGKPLTGSDQTKTKIPGWNATLKGKLAGWKQDNPSAASQGKVYGFATAGSSLELNSDTANHLTADGDTFRVSIDVGGNNGGKNSKTHYTFILGFKQGNKQFARYKLGESADNTDVSSGVRTLGYEYTAATDDVGKKPFLRIVMAQRDGKRAESFIDNVMLTVQPKGSSASQSPPMVAAVDPTPSPAPSVTPTPEPTPPEPAPAQRFEVLVIDNTEGRGADSTVKRGGSSRDTLGTKPNLAVQTRGGTEVQHAYIRFDLAAVSPDNQNGGQNRNDQNNKTKERKIGKVQLILQSLDGSAAGANIRVYGANNVNSERWLEEGPFALSWLKSFSNSGLDTLPLLADVSNIQVKDNTVTIDSPELSEFIRLTPLNTVTLILAGDNGNKPFQFVSRDGDRTKAPKLAVQIPTP